MLIDQEAIRSTAAASGVPWRYYDLGHGLCSYEFFELGSASCLTSLSATSSSIAPE